MRVEGGRGEGVVGGEGREEVRVGVGDMREGVKVGGGGMGWRWGCWWLGRSDGGGDEGEVGG